MRHRHAISDDDWARIKDLPPGQPGQIGGYGVAIAVQAPLDVVPGICAAQAVEQVEDIAAEQGFPTREDDFLRTKCGNVRPNTTIFILGDLVREWRPSREIAVAAV